MKQVKGFTLMESLLAIILTVIVVGFSYQLLILTTKQFKAYIHQASFQNNIASLYDVIERDVYKANAIYQANESQLILENASAENITYTFMDSCVVRSIFNVSDTFTIAHNSLFINNLLSGNNAKFNLNLVDTIRFTALLNGDSILFVYSKTYTPSEVSDRIYSNHRFKDGRL